MTTLRAALLAAAILTPAAALARPMTPEDVAKIEQVGGMAVSPDGQRIAFTTFSRPDITEGEENGSGSQQLKLTSAADAARAWLPEDMNVRALDFSPDGRMVSFLYSAGEEKTAVWGVPVDGGAHRKLAEVEDASVRSYRWAPNGAMIYMLVGAEADEDREAEAKDGFNAIVYEEEGRFNRMFAATAPVGYDGAIDSEPREIALTGYVDSFKIAGDNATGIVTTAPTVNVDDSLVTRRVNVIDLATGDVRTVVETPGKIGDVEISPDGTMLSLIAGIDVNDPAETTLHIVDVADGGYAALNEGAAEAAMDAEWLPDGRLASIIHVGAQSLLRIYNLADDTATEIDPGSLILRAVQAKGDTIAFAADSPMHPGELYVWDAANSEFDRWTTHNPWLAEIDMGTQRTMTYTARDGQEVEGILIEPVGGPARGGSPTIMMVHGGPEAHYSNGWLTAYSMPGQVGAGKGYATFHPNYRGSTGYGTDFSKQHQNDYAGKEFNDLVDAKMALVEAGITDPDRTGITGGSYGGYASAWGATAHTEHYAASVMFVGISNQISKFGTTDIPYEMYNVHSLKWPWEDWQTMLERSPIYYAGQARTPILIMHGAEDTRVAPSQSYELYRNIKVRTDTPVRLVLYPGEGHGNRMAASRYDYNLRMLRWFDRYLLGIGADDGDALPPSRPDLNAADEDEGTEG